MYHNWLSTSLVHRHIPAQDLGLSISKTITVSNAIPMVQLDGVPRILLYHFIAICILESTITNNTVRIELHVIWLRCPSTEGAMACPYTRRGTKQWLLDIVNNC